MTQRTLRHPNVSPTMDLIAKKVFSHAHITADFIKSVLKIPVDTVEILDGTQIQLEEYDHVNFYTAVDVLAKLDDGSQVIIEVQVTKQRAYFERLLTYVAKQINDEHNRAKGQGGATHTLFTELEPVYCIAILEHSLFSDDRALHTISLHDDDTLEPFDSNFGKGTVKTPMKFAFLELLKYDKIKVTEYDLQKWFEFFNNQPFDINLDPVIEEAEGLLDQTHWTKEEKQMFDQRKRNQDLYEGAMAQAAYDGEQKGKREVVLSSFKEGLSLELIAKITGLNKQDIEEIIQSNLV